jgi:hypothetical protein
MKLLIATRRGQGLHAGDKFECREGELVYFREVCPTLLREDGSPCPCFRLFRGLGSGNATTTAEVSDVPGITADEFRNRIVHVWRKDGRIGDGPDGDAPALAQAEELMRLAQMFPLYGVIERRAAVIRLRVPVQLASVVV